MYVYSICKVQLVENNPFVVKKISHSLIGKAISGCRMVG